MKLDNICFDIPKDKIINLFKNGTADSNQTLAFIDSWSPPLFHGWYGLSCGTFVKIIEELSKRLGYKYVKMKNLC